MLLIQEKELETLKHEIRTTKKEQFTRLIEQCKWYSEQELSPTPPPTSITYMGMAAANLSLAYLLTGSKQYLKEVKRWLFTAVGYDVWGYGFLVDVDLSASWLLYGFGLSYSWIRDALSEPERKLLLDKLILQGNKMYAYAQENKGNCWATDYWQNHNWINYCGLMTTAYAIRTEYPQAENWIRECVDNFLFVFDHMPQDGSNYEGTGYWRYAVTFVLSAAELIRQQEGIDLFRCGYLTNTFWFKLYQTAPNMEENINFGDVHDTRSSHSIAAYYKFAAEYQNEYAQWMAEQVRTKFLFREAYQSKLLPGILPEAFLELIWYRPEINTKEPGDLPLTRYFPDLGLVVIRSGWDRDAIHFSFKSSPAGGHIQWKESWKLNKANHWRTRSLTHYHVDFNNFILKAFDSSLAIDEGFNRTNRARHHSLITVDGQGCLGEKIWEEGSLKDPVLFDLNAKGIFNVWRDVPEEAVAEIEEFVEQDGYVYAVGESSKMYAPSLGLVRNARNVLYSENGYFILFDELASETEHEYTWHLQSEQPAEELRSGDFEIINGKGVLHVYTHADAPLKASAEETILHEIMTPQRPNDIRKVVLNTLKLKNERPAKTLTYINLLAPRSLFDAEPLRVEKIREDSVVGLKIFGDGFEELFLYSTDGTLAYQDVNETGKWLSIVKRDGKIVKKMVHRV